MMNLAKSMEVFNPNTVTDYIHIIGCGATGSCIGELLARFGLTKFVLWDSDIVEPKNLNNQMFNTDYIGWPKTEALQDVICSINPDAQADIILRGNWTGERVKGYVFLLIDNIDTCRSFVQANANNPDIKCVINTRTGLFDAQCWSADCTNPKDINNLLASMNFSHEDAQVETPQSSCGETLGVATTGRMITTLAVLNLIAYIKTGKLKKFISMNTDLDCDEMVTAM